MTFAHTLADAKREFEAEASSFDALVFDLDLPDGDSRTLIPEVAKVCPVVVLTGSQEPGFRYECMDLGATHVVGKCQPGGDTLRDLEACLRSAIKNGVRSRARSRRVGRFGWARRL